MTLLSWDLVSPLEYIVGSVLNFNLHFEAPINTATKKFYLLGGLYTLDGTYISGSLFGVLKENDYAVNAPEEVSIFYLEQEEEVELPCKFILGNSNCLLVLFLMRMVGGEPSLNDDEQLEQIIVQLVTPMPIEEQFSQNIIPFIIAAIVLTMIGFTVKDLFGGE